MKNPEANTLRIEPRKFHASAVVIAMMIAYLNYYYIIPAFRIAFPPIGLDTVVVALMGVTLNTLAFAHIIATSRTYIVSAKGITVIFLGFIRRLYPWQRFQSINACPIDIGNPSWGGQPFLMVCSTVPIRTMEGGKIDLERTIYRWPHILFFPLLPGEERMQFESLRRGKYLPTWRIRNPTRRNKYPS